MLKREQSRAGWGGRMDRGGGLWSRRRSVEQGEVCGAGESVSRGRQGAPPHSTSFSPPPAPPITAQDPGERIDLLENVLICWSTD
ncbi:unnamed protein product [Gadus morhua 'NCC']